MTNSRLTAPAPSAKMPPAMSKHDNTTTQPPAPERAKLHLGYLPDLIAANRRPLDHQAPQALWDAGLIWRSNRGTWGLSDAGRALLDDILKLLRGEARLAEPESEGPPSPTSRAIHLDLADFSDTAKKLGVDLVRTDPDGTAHLTEAGGALLHGTLERLRAEPPPPPRRPNLPTPTPGWSGCWDSRRTSCWSGRGSRPWTTTHAALRTLPARCRCA